MEEGMRRTLMRGMSAMNMEAMQLMAEARSSYEAILRRSVKLHPAYAYIS